jgi:argininosuccinate lyase
VSDSNTIPQGRLAGAKAATYLRAVNEPEARASLFTAPIMLKTDLAYVLSAAELKMLPENAARQLVSAVITCLDGLNNRDTTRPPGDIVTQREKWVTPLLDKESAAWIHLGRNRGESLRNLIPRLFFREVLHQQGQAIAKLIQSLVVRAETLLDALAPNYHHLQHSGLATVGEYLLSWAVTFERHILRLKQVDERLDMGPSAFGGRTEINALLDKVVARVGMTRRAQLRRDGIWQQDQFSEPFFVLSLIAVDLARFAQDLRIWVTPEFALFDLADEHAGGSSGLPHAKVPFGLQAVVGGGVMASTRLAGEMAAACSGPSEGSEPLYNSSTLYQTSLDILANTQFIADIVAKGDFRVEEMKRKALLDYAGTSEAHDRLVYDYGVPFKISHRLLGAMVRAHYYSEPLPDLNALLRAETGIDFAVDQDQIMKIMLGDIIWETTFDKDGIRCIWQEMSDKAQHAAALFDGDGVTGQALARLVDDAREFIRSR